MKPVQQPKQKRSQQTRLKIMQTALSVISEKGYHNVTVDDIAKEAGVSTGIAYRYFKNKKDLLMACLTYAFEHIKDFTRTDDITLSQFQSYHELLTYALDQFYELHRKYYAFHEELSGMAHTDEDVRQFYREVESRAIDELMARCPDQLKRLPNLRERFHLALGMMENYCHIALDGNSHELYLDFMKTQTVRAVQTIFELTDNNKLN